jgi:hypothetical protein
MVINNLRYNARADAFEASVDIQRGGRTFRYPCELQAPRSMDPATVTSGLAAHALRMLDTVHA